MPDHGIVTELFFGSGPHGDPGRAALTGSLPKEHHVAYGRDLTEGDMEALALPRPNGPARTLQRIHSSHHALARSLAVGMKATEASLVTGYSPGRISQLQRDPAFQALVADYSAEARSVFADFGARIMNLGLDGIEKLHERLHDHEEQWTVNSLLDLVKMCADRSGFGPGSQVNLRVDQDFIDRPPRETMDEWKARRNRELTTEDGYSRPAEDSGLGSPTRTTDRGNNGRLVS